MPPKLKENCHWTSNDVEVLLDYLFEHRAAAGDGANFQMKTFNTASTELNKHLTQGAPKHGLSCKNKWSCLQTVFRAIQAIKQKTGWTWSDTTGASITPDMDGAWRDFLKSNPKAKPFRNKGWPHLTKMTAIMPSTVKGTHVYRPSEGASGIIPENPGSPPWDIEDQDDAALSDSDSHPQSQERASSKPAPVAEALSDDSSATQVPRQAVPATPSARKRTRAVSETPARPSKRARITSADAIHGLTTSIGHFGDSICKVLAGDPSEKTPQRHKNAIKLAQKQGWLSVHDRLTFIKIVERDIKAADAFLALDADDTEFLKLWVSDKVATSSK